MRFNIVAGSVVGVGVFGSWSEVFMRKLQEAYVSGRVPGGNSLMSLTLANALLGYSDIDTRYQPCGEKSFDLEDFSPWHASEHRQPALVLPISGGPGSAVRGGYG